MKKVINKVINKFGYEIARVNKKHFTISDVEYLVGKYTVGQTPQGEITAKGAIHLIEERQLKDLKVLDICCGVGIIGLTIFSNLKKAGIVKEVAFADINIFNIESVLKTVERNNWGSLIGDTIRCHLSDCLKNIPVEEKFDIIVSNPPHFIEQSFHKQDKHLSPNRLGSFDPNWNFHKDFYNECHNYLTDTGEVWFLEHGWASNEDNFLPFIAENKDLKYVEKIEEPLDPNLFWMITQKV